MFLVFYIRFYTDGMINKILNINIFKILVGDSIYEVKLKFLFCMKKIQKPSKNYRHVTDVFSYRRWFH